MPTFSYEAKDNSGRTVSGMIEAAEADGRLKPGGTHHDINPIAWGTYSPGYAKMAAPYGITLQPADCPTCSRLTSPSSGSRARDNVPPFPPRQGHPDSGTGPTASN